MIIICEPNCRDHSHETFNLGFIHGARKAWPDEDILVLADSSHIKTVLNNAKHFPADLKNVSWKSIRLYLHSDFINVVWNFFLIWRVLRLARRKKARGVMFLSSTQVQQRIIKYFGSKKEYEDVIITINLHGELDRLAYPNFQITMEDVCWNSRKDDGISGRKKNILQRMWEKKRHLHKILLNRMVGRMKLLWEQIGAMTFPQLDLRATLLQNNKKNIRYVCLADHVSENLKKYIDVRTMNIRTIVLPAVFHPTVQSVNNDFLKVATFGYGHSTMLYKLNCALEKLDVHNKYEIRVIGMDGRGIERFPHVTQPINRLLTRQEMERLAEDIDMFLILYEKERYILSCSGSIIEAHQYGKPILYLENPCIDAFNPKECPIGIASKDIEVMAQVLADIVNNYQRNKNELLKYKKNIICQRKKIDINNNLERMRALLK